MKYVNTSIKTANLNTTYPIITSVEISGMDNSIAASGYPMATDATNLLPNRVADNDMKRANKLASAPSGSGHDCFLKGIVVQMDVTFSEKAWPEAQRYHWFDFVSSMSTMHMLPKMDIKYIEYTDPEIIKRFEELVAAYNEEPTKENWLRMIYSYPSGLLLTARITTNYMQLKAIYHQRRNHRLPEWQEFCDWVEGLPHSKFITGKTEEYK